jgi:alpha-galactosidase
LSLTHEDSSSWNREGKLLPVGYPVFPACGRALYPRKPIDFLQIGFAGFGTTKGYWSCNGHYISRRMPVLHLASFAFDDFTLRYQAPADAPRAIGCSLVPTRCLAACVTPREHLEETAVCALPARWLPLRAWEVDPLVHVHVRPDAANGGLSQGRTLHAGPSTRDLLAIDQQFSEVGGRSTVTTRLQSARGFECLHTIEHRLGERALRVQTRITNVGTTPLPVELLTSFSLGGITPFHRADAPGQLWLHRFRSSWSAEGRHERLVLEDLQLERSWTGHSVQVERFGQIGSLPVRGFFPFAAIEDGIAGVCWGAQLAHPGSWQMEVFRRADQVSLSGGLADREFGHWWKTLQPSETLEAPEAFIAASADGFEDLCDRLTGMQRGALQAQPASEKALPIVFNEWCSTWGSPTHESVIAAAERLHGTGVRYFVIDDGWAERIGDGFQQNGDWLVNRDAFPEGFRSLNRDLRERGFIPGLWFEFEVTNEGSRAFAETTHQLQRDGHPLQVGTRRFWDFRDPWVHEFLAARVIDVLREGEFGYLKVDYNDSIGTGCDGSESPGESLRQHLAGVQEFFRRLRTALPELVIENCSSGGHRLEPSMLALTSLSSCSDAHETRAIPIIAANVHALILPAQSLVWAVLREPDNDDRLCYSLAATFLGRMCLSGDIHRLKTGQWQRIRAATDLYRALSPLIADGVFRRHGSWGNSYHHPTGWQAVVATSQDGTHAMVVWHAFENTPSFLEPLLPAGRWQIARMFQPDQPAPGLGQLGTSLQLNGVRPWTGGVVELVASPS